MGFQIAGLWWTDVYKMTEHFKSVSMRRDEKRGAAYLGKKAFEDIATLPDAVAGDSGHALVERFKREGIPALTVRRTARRDSQDAARVGPSPSTFRIRPSTCSWSGKTLPISAPIARSWSGDGYLRLLRSVALTCVCPLNCRK